MAQRPIGIRIEIRTGLFGLDDFIAKFKTLCTGNWEGGKHEVTSVHIDKIVNNTDGLIDTYNELKKKMYVYLGIPRIRFPWRSEDGTEIFLTNVYVDNTDLRYKTSNGRAKTRRQVASIM